MVEKGSATALPFSCKQTCFHEKQGLGVTQALPY